MPLYEYLCTDCLERVEVLSRTYGEPKNLVCKKCGSTHLRRVMSTVTYNKLNPGSLQDLSVIDRDVTRRFEKKLRGDSLLG